MADRRIAARRSRRGTRAMPLALTSLAILVGGWSILWLFARREADLSFDRWIATEHREGRDWTCPNRTINGFPLSIVLSCDRPTFADGTKDGSLRGSLATVRAEALLYFPTKVLVDLGGPLTLDDPAAKLALRIAWSRARVELRGSVPGDLDRGSLDAEGLEIQPAPDVASTRIGSVGLSLRPLTRQGAAVADAQTTLKIGDLRSPDADAAMGSADPISAAATAVTTGLTGEGSNLPTILEAWRGAGGQLQISSLVFTKGPFRAEVDGRLALDEEHRVEGRGTARLTGVEPIAARFGIPLAAVQLGGALSSLLGGKSVPAGGSTLDLPVSARNGRLSIGPVRTGVPLPPLY